MVALEHAALLADLPEVDGQARAEILLALAEITHRLGRDPQAASFVELLGRAHGLAVASDAATTRIRIERFATTVGASLPGLPAPPTADSPTLASPPRLEPGGSGLGI